MSSSSRPWGLGLVVCGWLLGVGFSTIALSVLQAADGLNLETPSLVVVALLQAALWFGLLVVPLWLICSKRVVLSELGWGFKYRDFFSGLLIGVGTQMVLVPIIYLPLRLLDDNFDVSGPAREVVEKASGFGIVLLVLVVVVFGPIVEEIFFRGFVLTGLIKRYGVIGSLLFSSLLFGVFHFAETNQVTFWIL